MIHIKYFSFCLREPFIALYEDSLFCSAAVCFTIMHYERQKAALHVMTNMHT